MTGQEVPQHHGIACAELPPARASLSRSPVVYRILRRDGLVKRSEMRLAAGKE